MYMYIAIWILGRIAHPYSNICRAMLYAVQCSEECVYWGSQSTSKTVQDRAVYFHLTDKGQQCTHTGQRRQVFEREVKEAIYVKLKQPSLNRGCDLTHHLSATYNAVLTSLSRQLGTHSYLDSNDCCMTASWTNIFKNLK